MATPKPRIKVMQVIARMNVGGPAVIVAEIVRGLDGSKFDQLLVTGFCDQDEADYLETVATDIKALRIAGLGRSVSPLADAKAFFQLIKIIREYKPDVIHTHTAKAGVLGRLASLLACHRVIRIHTFHGHLLHGYFSPWKTKLVIYIEKFLAIFTHSLIAIGNKVKDDLLAAGIGNSQKFQVFFPGLPEPQEIDRQVARQELGFDKDGIYITFVGRLTQIKRPDRLLAVAAEMQKRNLPANFIIAGEGDLFEKSRDRAIAQGLPVRFLGWRSDIDTLFAASDIAILTSDNEGIPLTLIQAAQARLPIVATNVGSMADIVLNESNGYLTEPNPLAIADALEKLVRDPALREYMGASGHVRSHEYFSLERMLVDHSDLYKKLF
jgi:glycosyltransferase involved in cell wall biosynthesis